LRRLGRGFPPPRLPPKGETSPKRKDF